MRYLLVLAGIALTVLAVFHPAPRAPQPVERSSTRSRHSTWERTPERSAGIVVYVAGSVRRPGLYRLAQDARADAAVARAGGFARDADEAGVDLAEHLQDGDEVEVPAIGEKRRKRTTHMTRRRSSHRRRTFSGVVDVNAADAPALAQIPGIGEAIAARIVEIREQEGPYDSLDELLDVAGMTDAKLERARQYLRL